MKKILIIDDEKPTLNMFRLFLSAYGYEVLLAENGLQGLEIFRKEGPPIVLTDIKMPGMDGLEVLRQVKEIAPRTEVIVISGHGDMDLAMRALQLNASDFLSKPVQKSELDIALKRAEERIKQETDPAQAIRYLPKGGRPLCPGGGGRHLLPFGSYVQRGVSKGLGPGNPEDPPAFHPKDFGEQRRCGRPDPILTGSPSPFGSGSHLRIGPAF